MESILGWSEVVKATDRKATTLKQVLRTVFPRNGVPKMIATDNALEFCDDKTSPYQPQSNEITERMTQTVKMLLNAFFPLNENIEA